MTKAQLEALTTTMRMLVALHNVLRWTSPVEMARYDLFGKVSALVDALGAMEEEAARPAQMEWCSDATRGLK